jgi:hypothetical protein
VPPCMVREDAMTVPVGLVLVSSPRASIKTFTPFLDSLPCCRYSAATPHFVYRSFFADWRKDSHLQRSQGGNFCGHFKRRASSWY